MKLLVALGSLQLVLILFLIVSIDREDQSIERGVRAVDTGAAGSGTYDAPPAVVAPVLDEERLRQIIREEVSYLSQDVREDRHQEGNNVAMATEDPQARAMERDYVAQQIEYYRSLGSISPEEMEELQSDVANLASADRKQMMSRLVRAMNAGEISGRLQ